MSWQAAWSDESMVVAEAKGSSKAVVQESSHAAASTTSSESPWQTALDHPFLLFGGISIFLVCYLLLVLHLRRSRLAALYSVVTQAANIREIGVKHASPVAS